MKKDKHGLTLIDYIRLVKIVLLLAFLCYAIPNLYRQHQENKKWRQEIEWRQSQWDKKH